VERAEAVPFINIYVPPYTMHRLDYTGRSTEYRTQVHGTLMPYISPYSDVIYDVPHIRVAAGSDVQL